MSQPLKIKALNLDDIKVISSLLQDMTIQIGDIAYMAEQNQLALVGNRFRWEKKQHFFSRPKGERVRTALHFNGVLNVSAQNIDHTHKNDVLALLAITAEETDETFRVMLEFSGGATMRLDNECIELIVTDVSDSWEAITAPKHKI